jgi:hypothetical protein
MPATISRSLVAAVLAALLPVAAAQAACPSVPQQIIGSVQDAKGNIIPDANVRVTWIQARASRSREATADADGQFRIAFDFDPRSNSPDRVERCNARLRSAMLVIAAAGFAPRVVQLDLVQGAADSGAVVLQPAQP